MAKSLDRLDRRILERAAGGRASPTRELAKRVASPPPCWRRLQRLERDGFISAHVTLLDAALPSACRSRHTRWSRSRIIIRRA